MKLYKQGNMLDALNLARRALVDGQNMIETLTQKGFDRFQSIEIAYALQSGSYTKMAMHDTTVLYRTEVQSILKSYFETFGITRVLDCGAGEGTSWIGFDHPLEHLALLDLSLNRLTWITRNQDQLPKTDLTLIKGSIEHLPVMPGAFDAVVTMHALEPNGPSAHALVTKLATKAGRFLICFEPDYAKAPPAMKARMNKHGYAQDIFSVIDALPDFETLKTYRLDHPSTVLNATSVIIAKRKLPLSPSDEIWADPLEGRPLKAVPGGLEDERGNFIYPELHGIKCLNPDDGVLMGRQ